MKKIILILVLTLTVSAQDAVAVSINNIYLPINNRGILADVNIPPYGSLGRYPGPTGNGFLFSGGFALSGYQNDQLWSNAVLSAALYEDYQPGKVGGNPQDSTNQIYAVLETDPHFGQSWQNWKKAVEHGAYFYDGDNDGVYDPVDKNNNGQWDTNEDKPDLLYDGTYYTVFNDGVAAGERRWENVNPLGIEIRQTAFASHRNTLLDDVLFIRYSLLYKGLENPSEPDSLTDVIFSIWNDPDIGEGTGYTDDLVGCDTTLKSGYTYNDGEDDDWGINPPAIFKTIVQGPLVKTNNFEDVGFNRMGPELGIQTYAGYKNVGIGSFTHLISGEPALPSPGDAVAARNFMKGRIGFSGAYLNPCDWPFGEVRNMDCSAVNKLFWYSGDPVSDIGWLCTDPGDQFDFTSTEQFTLVKNEPMDIIIAYIVGRGTDHLNSITRAREITQYVHEEYERNFSTIVGVEDKPEEVVNSFSLSQNYPNPFNPTTTIKFSIPSNVKSETSNTKLIVYDILGRKIKTLVNEVKSPGSYEVQFDASQFASGVYFYRITAGNFVQTKKMILLR